MNLENVIWSENLSENLVSLRKFVDQGLSIYLDNQCINIYDPSSNESLLTGIYERPFWIIEFEVDKSINAHNKTNKVNAYLMTRSMTQKERTNEIIESTNVNSNKVGNNKNVSESKHANEYDEKIEIENLKSKDCSDFDVTVRERKIVQTDQTQVNEDMRCDIEFESNTKQIGDKAMLWHVNTRRLNI